MMLSQVSKTGAVRAVINQPRRALSVPPKTTLAGKTVEPTLAVKPPNISTPPKLSVATDPKTGSSLPKLLLLGLLTTPAATAVYVKLNPQWNPAALKHDARWIKFRELVLSNEATETIVAPTKRSPEKFSSAMNENQLEVNMEKKENKKENKEEKKKKEKKEEKKKKEKKEEKKKKKEEIKEKKEEIKEKKKEENKGEKMEKGNENAAMQIEKKLEEEDKIKEEGKTKKLKKKLEKAAKKAQQAEKKVLKLKNEVEAKKVEGADEKSTVTNAAAAASGATSAFDKKVEALTVAAQEEIAKLAGEASPEQLGYQMTKQIQTTTNELLSALKAESDAAAAEMDKQYLSELHELDARALAIRVAQLSTEMKHRSKWEAVRLLESLRLMEGDVHKKSTEVLHRQHELHKELLARELRLQQELLSRQSREDMQALEQQYADDLARTVSQNRASLLSELQRTFAREVKAIQERYATQLQEVTQNMQKALKEERANQVQELEKYRAELRALGTVLDSSSTYEAFSHRVHKTSMAALALSDRVEAAAPLRSELRALREAARNDPLIEAAVKSLPQEAIEQGAPSVGQLQDRFKVVKSVGHRTALVSENSGLIGQMFGTALSLLMIPPGGPIKGVDTDAVLSRAEFALKAGDLETAVEEMKALSGLPAQVSQDWIAAAECRLAVEQTAKVIKAHVALLAASCS